MLISMTPTELPRSSLPLRAPHLRTAYRFNLRGNPAGHRLRRARSVGVCLAQLKPWSALTSYIPALPKHPNPVMQAGVAEGWDGGTACPRECPREQLHAGWGKGCV